MVTNVEGGKDYVGWELWDNDGRGSSVEEEWDNKRRVAVIRNEGSEATRVTAWSLMKMREVMSRSMQHWGLGRGGTGKR